MQRAGVESNEFESVSKAWVPPSMNSEQRHGNIFSIKDPEDLLDFVSEDDRLCVGKPARLHTISYHLRRGKLCLMMLTILSCSQGICKLVQNVQSFQHTVPQSCFSIWRQV
jgi:hypothetical protein